MEPAYGRRTFNAKQSLSTANYPIFLYIPSFFLYNASHKPDIEMKLRKDVELIYDCHWNL